MEKTRARPRITLPNQPGEQRLSQDQLEARMRMLARSHRTTRKQAGNLKPLTRSLGRDETLLLECYRLLSSSEYQLQMLPGASAAEWIVDNIQLLLENVREVRKDLPASYYSELPKLSEGPQRGLPRVFGVAREYVSHTNGVFDSDGFLGCISAYQEVSELTMGELWAGAIMLRTCLIERLSRYAASLLASGNDRKEGQLFAKRIIGGDSYAMSLLEHRPTSRPFVLELLRGLRDSEEDTDQALAWLDKRMSRLGGSVSELVRLDHRVATSEQTAVSSIIDSLRSVSQVDWSKWFETASQVDSLLSQDPAGVYTRQIFSTRDYYRHQVEELARGSRYDEVEIAQTVLDLCRAEAVHSQDIRHAHVGYYLINKGRGQLEKELGYVSAPKQRFRRFVRSHATPVYIGGIALTTAAITALALRAAGKSQKHRIAAASLTVIPASEAARQLVDWTVTRLIPPRRMPRLDLKAGIPDEYRTIVVVPLLLLTDASVDGQFDRLEVLHLANSDKNLHFALLSDFASAPNEVMPDDEVLLKIALQRIEQLSEKYGKRRFLFFHRRRVWNESEQIFMGWERKRGKLEEFNRLLNHDRDTTFEVVIGDVSVLDSVRYVITLDADTQLPRDGARDLIAAMAHPLNAPIVDKAKRRVVEGYGMLQPRVTTDLTAARKSRFAEIFSGSVGIDSYTTAISDAYMDLFDEGIFMGKGIYDPRTLYEVLDKRFPTNQLLSHDLIEGTYARAGLISSLELRDNFPSSWAASLARSHRWIRGDWQLLPWLGRSTPIRGGGKEPNPLSVISRYKILDNMRRSLVPPTSTALVGCGWILFGGNIVAWTAAAVLPWATPAILSAADLIVDLARKREPLPALPLRTRDLRRHLLRLGVNASLMIDLTVNNLDGVARALHRQFVSHSNLLEWETAEQSQERLSSEESMIRYVASAGAGVSLLAPLLQEKEVRAISLGIPLVAGWVASDPLVKWLNAAPTSPEHVLLPAERELLARLACEYWEYFKAFVSSEGHFLAADNYQEGPDAITAFRTSPTNIGLQLLADLAAHDFGFVGMLEIAERTQRTLDTLEQLEKWQGHLFNWYDTKSATPLEPRYVSTVDSGNLAAFLIALSQGYRQMQQRKVIEEDFWEGLRAPLGLLRAQLTEEDPALAAGVAMLFREVSTPPQSIQEYVVALKSVIKRSRALAGKPAAHYWATRLREQAQSLLRDLELFFPGADDPLPNPSEAVMALYGTPMALGELPAMLRAAAEAKTPLSGRYLAAAEHAEQLLSHQAVLADRAAAMAMGMDFRPLYDPDSKLFYIGTHPSDESPDPYHYGNLASEARLASFVAIAKGDVDQEHWFALGRKLTPSSGGPALVSWTGTMFEYLMPQLVMRSYPSTLLDETISAAVRAQIFYAHDHRIPWGISESAYYAQDINQNYQYKAFGVPELGTRRGLDSDLVVAPYATMLAVSVEPQAAIRNLLRLIDLEANGTYGMYDAVDFTQERMNPGERYAVIPSFLVHHQGMSLLSLDNFLHANIMRERFHADPVVKATDLLLQEQAPIHVALQPRLVLPEGRQTSQLRGVTAARDFVTPFRSPPSTHLLSNGHLTTVITTAGSGFLRFEGVAVTRWREDSISDNWGSYVYVKDLTNNQVWSPTYQPTRHELSNYRCINSLAKVEYSQYFDDIVTRMEVAVSPDDDVEIRHIALTNVGDTPREFEVTTFSEICLDEISADMAHPAFRKLFVETEFLPEADSLLAHRRPRETKERPLWAMQVVAARGYTVGETEFESDRAAFLGRGSTYRHPISLDQPLSGRTGDVLDPAFCLRRRVRIMPRGTAHLAFSTGVGATRDEVVELAHKYRDLRNVWQAVSKAQARAEADLHDLQIDPDDAHRFQRLLANLLYLDPSLRAGQSTLQKNSKSVPELWRYGISGDLPILVAHIANADEIELAEDLVKAHQYWRVNGLTFDLVFIDDEGHSYIQEVHDQLVGLAQTGGYAEENGGVHVLRKEEVEETDLVLLETAARAMLTGDRGNLVAQLRKPEHPKNPVFPKMLSEPGSPPAKSPGNLLLAGKYGGFSEDGTEYVLTTSASNPTPAPWTNVIANPNVGCVVSERGSTYTWAQNSREHRITAWSNDPVIDPTAECVYLRDEANNATWSPTPNPMGVGEFTVRHGFGYTSFASTTEGIASDLEIFVDATDPVKIYRLRLHNTTDTARRLTSTLYAALAMGVFREQTAPFIVTSFDQHQGVLLAKNPAGNEFANRIAFFAADTLAVSVTGDRKEFIGRTSDPTQPVGMQTRRLSGNVGAGKDPCAALRRFIDLKPGENKEVFFLIGDAASPEEAMQTVARYRTSSVEDRLKNVKAEWKKRTNQLRVKTPSAELDVLVNGWLIYQALSCRIWARSAAYQPGGAYGFRDQLQDVAAMVYSEPGVAREHILRAAGRQFVEGDVQHWWHPPTGRGIRTRISDNYLWLPFVAHHYATVTGDTGIFNEEVAFLTGQTIPPDQDTIYEIPQTGPSGSLYEHCARALDRALDHLGAHSLPLMGDGDWNDGMNLVGHGGKGESVWLGWFLAATLNNFAGIAEARGDEAAKHWREAARKLMTSIDRSAWDGNWYLRAFFDDGTPLGSSKNDECSIDIIAQAWSVLADAPNQARATSAMKAVDEKLVNRETGLIQLLSPPFNNTDHNPGYIKGYLPGIRENGGQYTHGAVWAIWAMAQQGNHDRAMELFDLINPVRHSNQNPDVYRVEPYVAVADIYDTPSLAGRGGWSWYTGSAGWLYRLCIEMFCGLQLRGSKLTLAPHVPSKWDGFELDYLFGSTEYKIKVSNPEHLVSSHVAISLDGKSVEFVDLKDDGVEHSIIATITEATTRRAKPREERDSNPRRG